MMKNINVGDSVKVGKDSATFIVAEIFSDVVDTCLIWNLGQGFQHVKRTRIRLFEQNSRKASMIIFISEGAKGCKAVYTYTGSPIFFSFVTKGFLPLCVVKGKKITVSQFKESLKLCQP